MQKTEGKIKQKNIDKYLNTETKNLSTAYSREFIKGWYEEFNYGVEVVLCKFKTNDVFGKNHIYWENPMFKGS